jgi:hypothetical protein
LLAARESSPEHFGQVIAAGRPYAAPEGRYWGIEADIDRHGRSLHPSRSDISPVQDFTVAETTKLSVGKALDKLRGADTPKTKMTQLDEKIAALDEETQRLRAMRRRIERDQQAGSTGSDVQEANTKRITKLKILGIIIVIIIVIPILAWKWGLL